MVGDSAAQLNRRYLLARFVPENLMSGCQSQSKYLVCKNVGEYHAHSRHAVNLLTRNADPVLEVFGRSVRYAGAYLFVCCTSLSSHSNVSHRRIDDTAAQTHLTIIKHHILTRGDGALRYIEFNSCCVVSTYDHCAVLIGLPIA